MYRITYDGLTIFDPYGDADEVVSDASMSVEVNASAYLDFTMAMTHPLYDTIRERAGVVTLTWDSTVLFEGIIESIEMDIQGNKSISCVSAMDYLNDTHVRPYSTVAGEADLTAPSSVDGYFQWLIDQHNDHVLDASKMFDVGINQGANLQQNNFIYRSSESEPTTASEITDQILDSLGGYLTMRYEDGRKVLDLYADLHTMNAQIVDFGVNITNFTKTTDTTDQYTAILLHGGSPTFEGGDLEGGDWSHWETHPNTPLVGDKTHGGSVASYFVSGTGEYINDSFFYSRPGRRYKASVYVKNERGSNVTIRGSYQYEQAGGWTTVNVNSSLTVENQDDQWVEFSFDFQPNLSEYTKIRPRWYFDNVGNDGNRRVYLDDFSFSQIEGDTEVSEDPIGLKQVPDGVSSFDADVFKSGDVLYSTSAVERYGYKEEVFEDTTITNIDDLVQAGIKELNKSKEPQITLDIKAVDLALFMEGYTHLNVGDAVRVRSAIHDTDEFLMVNSITLDLQDPGQSEYVIGKAYDSLTGQQSGFLRSLNSGINSSLDAVASLDQTTKDQAIQLGAVENVANQAKDTANNAQNIANNAQNTANSNKEAIDSIKDAQTEYEKQLEQMQQGVADATEEIGQVNERIEGMNSEIESAKSDIDSLRSSTETELQNVKQSVSDVQSDVDAVTQKASDLASDLDGTKATVEQVTTDLGEVKTTVSNAATKADQALQVSTSASQTATEAKTTATSAYQDAQSALIQSSTASQTANAVKTELETKYSTTDEIAEQYATKSLVEQTSQSITSTVEATYATKATVEALENIANNAVQTWMGSGVPTLSNKPASDWTTAELKSQHSGDIYYDSDTGYSYRFGSSDGKNYSWSLIKDTDISKAVADAAKAQQTAEGVSDEVTQLKTDIPATYATKTEVKQTTDSIKSTVSEVASTANSALSKVSSLEVSVDGIDAKVEENASDIADAVKTTSQVSQRVDSLTSTITQVVNNPTAGNLWTNQWFDDDKPLIGSDGTETPPSGGKSRLLQGRDHHNDSVRATVYPGHRYRITADAKRTAGSLSLHAGIWYTNKTSGTAWDTYGKASGLVADLGNGWNRYKWDCTVPSGKQKGTLYFQIEQSSSGGSTKWLVANAILEDITAANDAQSTANSALSQSSTVQQELTSFKTSVQQTYETKNDALSKQSSLQQSVNNLRTEVSETYTTKTEFDALEIGGTNLFVIGTSKDGFRVSAEGGEFPNSGYTISDYISVQPNQKYILTAYMDGSEDVSNDYVAIARYRSNKAWIDRPIMDTNSFGYGDSWVITTTSETAYVRLSFPTSGKDKFKFEQGSKSTAWSPAPEDMLSKDEAETTYSTKSYVDQTARTVSLGVVEEYKDGQHGSALATQSDITATKNSITQTVSQTYLSKTDATNTYLNKNTAASTYATKTEVKQTSDSLTVSIKESLGVANAAASSVLVKNGDFESNSTEGWTFTGFSSPYVNATNPYTGTYKLVAPVSGSGSHTMVNDAIIPVYQGQKFRFRCALHPDSTISNDLSIGFIGDNNALITSVVGSVTGGAWHVYSAVITVPSGVKSMRARIATNNDSFVNLRVDSITVTDVTDGVNAQSTANTANSNAQNAQNRVGNLETCIKMTSDGVRVGKISNGNFTGYSALVNSAGSFDILDASSKTLAFFNKDGLSIKSTSDRGMFVGFDSVSNSGYIGSMPKVATSEGGQSIDIGMSMGFASGGYLSILNSLGGAAIIANGIDLIATGGKRVRIDMMDVRGAGVVLFDRDDGNNYASIDIAPRYNFGEFNYIMCFFKTNDGQYFGGTAYHPNGKEYCFTTMGGGAGSTDMSYLKGTRWYFDGTKATRRTTFEIGPGYSTAVNDAVMHIVAIIGFDYYKTSG